MNWNLLLITFSTIFLAELGDKTQLATLSLAASGGSRWTVFIASTLALCASSAIAVLAGAAVGRLVPPHYLKRGAGTLFVILGVLFLLNSRS